MRPPLHGPLHKLLSQRHSALLHERRPDRRRRHLDTGHVDDVPSAAASPPSPALTAPSPNSPAVSALTAPSPPSPAVSTPPATQPAPALAGAAAASLSQVRPQRSLLLLLLLLS